MEQETLLEVDIGVIGMACLQRQRLSYARKVQKGCGPASEEGIDGLLLSDAARYPFDDLAHRLQRPLVHHTCPVKASCRNRRISVPLVSPHFRARSSMVVPLRLS